MEQNTDHRQVCNNGSELGENCESTFQTGLTFYGEWLLCIICKSQGYFFTVNKDGDLRSIADLMNRGMRVVIYCTIIAVIERLFIIMISLLHRRK